MKTTTQLQSNLTLPFAGDESYLQTLSESGLRNECVLRLAASYGHRSDVFHERHEALNRVIRECSRRGRADLFDAVFYEL